MIISTMMFITAIILTLTTLIIMISKKTYMDREKSSPFECGFDPLSNPRTPFSLQFFLIAVIFLIFDIEITLIIPMIPMIKIINMKIFVSTFSSIMTILMFGAIYEWTQGSLNWSL